MESSVNRDLIFNKVSSAISDVSEETLNKAESCRITIEVLEKGKWRKTLTSCVDFEQKIFHLNESKKKKMHQSRRRSVGFVDHPTELEPDVPGQLLMPFI